MIATSKLPTIETSIFAVMSGLANRHSAINLSQGFPNFEIDPIIQELVYKNIKDGLNQYAPMPGWMPLREQIAQKIERLYQVSVNPDTEITITAGATQAIFCAIAALVHQGDEVILVEPAYDSYAPCVQLQGAIPVPYELQAPHYQIDWQQMEQLVTPKTRMLIVNTPHNPTGSILQQADMLALQKLAVTHDLIVLSDEVYEHLIYDGEQHETALKYSDLYQRTVATYSFGKTFHATGWKTGYCVAPPHLTHEIRKIHQFNVFSVNTPMQAAYAQYMEHEANYLELSSFFQSKRDFFAMAMAQSRFKAIPAKGTYFQLYDYSAISDERDVDFAKRVTIEYGVASIPISVFYSSQYDAKVLRFCFAKTAEVLEQAAALLVKI